MTVAFLSTSSDVDNALTMLLTELNGNLLLNGQLLENISVNSSTSVRIGHSLGRVPSGYIITKKNALCDIYHTELTSEVISVRGSTSAILNIWVF